MHLGPNSVAERVTMTAETCTTFTVAAIIQCVMEVQKWVESQQETRREREGWDKEEKRKSRRKSM